MHYLLTASLLLLLLWPAYALLLRYSRHYVLLRALLLLAMLAVAGLPFVDFSSPAPVVTESIRTTFDYVEAQALPTPASVAAGTTVETAAVAVTPERASVPLPLVVYGTGAAILCLLLLIRLLTLFSWHLRSRPKIGEGFRLLPASARPGQAFTFGRGIYFSPDIADGADFDHVLAHERVHARQGHSLDILLGELFLCVFWFHPVAWWLRAKLRANLEYLVDATVVRRTEKRGYQLALLRQSQYAHGLALALPFSEPTLKDRITRLSVVPRYRFVAGVASLGLLLWLGLTLTVLSGNTEHSPHREYLPATAQAGDPYYAHYRETLPEAVYSFELYTNRMVTMDEYLQLRAILGRAPETALHVYKNAFDEGFSLAIRHGGQEPAVAHRLHATPADRFSWYLGLEFRAGTIGDLELFGQEKAVNWSNVVRLQDELGMKFVTKSKRLGSSLNLDERGELRVLVNGKPLRLLPAGTSGAYEINGVDVSGFGAADWPLVRVEGLPQLAAPDRLAKLLTDKPFAPADIQYFTGWQTQGTYREWYEGLDVHAGRSLVVQYNDRLFGTTLDFLLDTEFGPRAMIQVGHERGVPDGKLVVQVIDDDARAVDKASGNSAAKILFPGLGTDHKRAHWTVVHYATGPGMMEYLLDRLAAENLSDRSLTFYLNDQPIDIAEFGGYPHRPGAFLRFGTLTDVADSPVIAQIVDPSI